MHNQIAWQMDMACKLILSYKYQVILKIIFSSGICIWNISLFSYWTVGKKKKKAKEWNFGSEDKRRKYMKDQKI